MQQIQELLGPKVSSGVAAAIAHLIDDNGGVGGLVRWLETHGLGETALSWVDHAPNLPMSALDLQRALGSGAAMRLSLIHI